MCLSRYRNAAEFAANFNSRTTLHYLQNREQMIVSEVVPSLTIAKLAYGESVVKTFLREQLFDLAKFFGNTKVTSEQVDMISSLIMVGNGYLKVTEIQLAFAMMKMGQLRQNDTDRAKMYGNFNGEVIMDCLYVFKQYRNEVLNQEEARRSKCQAERENKATISYSEYLRRNPSAENVLGGLAASNGWTKEQG